MKYINLSKSGSKIPIIGFGTWLIKKKKVEEAVTTALEIGYRHFDTGFNYNNEELIGVALKKWMELGKGKREDLFITTKLPNIANRAKDVQRFLKMSLDKLQLKYIDLYLIHKPFGFKCNESTLTPLTNSAGDIEIDKKTDIVEIWKMMEEQVRQGLTKNIGLSNFNSRQIRKIHENAIIKSAILQVELHAAFQQKEIRKICKELGIVITAYSPLANPGAKKHFKVKYNYEHIAYPNTLDDPEIKKLAIKYKRTPAQILLRHLIQQNIVAIPKSVHANRMKENISLFDFEISKEDSEKINMLDCGERARIFNFLFLKGAEEHPEFPFKKV